jgi:2-oxoisovalerate dehydrogenase E1 component
MQFDRKKFSNTELISFYRELLYSRMIEEKMIVLLRQGKVSKWFSGIGQEAISVGATMAMQHDEWIMPLHRNLGVFTVRGASLEKLFLQWQGSKEGFSKGRERSFHFGSHEHHIAGMISHLGPQLALADGAALAYKLKGERKVALAFTGDGGTSEGDFHEALNVAAVWDLPVIFIIENNGYGLSTPTNEQYRCESLVDKAYGYGIEGIKIDGNNILEVYDTIRGVRNYCIDEQKPYVIECMTFRMRGHEEASGVKYVPNELFEEWEKKDPVRTYEEWLLSSDIMDVDQLCAINDELRLKIEEELKAGLAFQKNKVDLQEELKDVYAPFSSKALQLELPATALPQRDEPIRMINAISEALDQSLALHENLVVMGQDIAEYGGAFKVTEGLVHKYGKSRIRNTPLCESAIVGTALGLSLEGYKSVVEMQFADFVSVGFNQIVNNLAKIYYRWGQNADVVIRMPTGAGVSAGPFHSQSNEAWFFHVPGLKIVYPSNPADAKGLLMAAIQDPNPVMYFEHKVLYRSISGEVDAAPYVVEIGKAAITQPGDDLSVITYGAGVHWTMEYAKQHPELSIEILDLRSLMPLDYQAIQQTVKKTNRVLVLHEDNLTGGIGAEIAAWISEHCFQYLDAPVMRCASLDTPIPFSPELEQQYLAKSRLHDAMQRLLNY